MSLENLAEVKLKDNSLKVLNRRYLRKNEKGEVIESPEQLFTRVAEYAALGEVLYKSDKRDVLKGVKYKNIEGSFLLFRKDEGQYNSNHKRYISNLKKLKQNYKSVDKIAGDIYNMMVNFEFMPNSPTLMNADTPLGQLSACFVLPVDDSMDSIFQTLKDTAMIHKSGGGTGFSFSRLRPKNAVVKSTGGVASGPISFMKVYNASTEAVKQGGTRRGANMGILRVDHPDIIDFIKCKEEDKQINNFNISVAITDEFMKKAENNEYYSLIDPRTKKEIEKLNAREVFDLIAKQAHKNGEPGVIFIDRINQYNPTRDLEGEIESTNPCGEQPLLPYESCNLGSINLGKFVKDKKIDENKLADIVARAIHFMDNVIDLNKYPLAQIEEKTKRNRKIGLGVMGLADMLVDLGIPYNSDEAVNKAEEVMLFINKKAREASEKLAEERKEFPNFKKSIYAGEKKRRNATITTIAPTGTISIIANDCSSGIEPFFALVYGRENVEESLGELFNFNERFENIARERGFYSEELIKEIAKNGGSVKGNPKVPLDIQKLFVTARDIEAEYHVRMQAAFQKHVDNAVSKTINFPNSATIEDVKRAYLRAYELRCKGITVYRDGSRERQVLVAGKKETLEKIAEEHKIAPRPRPEVLSGKTTKVNTGCGNLYVTTNYDEEEKPFELFMQMGKAGGCAASQLEAIGRLISLAFRSGIDVKEIKEQLIGIRCPSPSWNKGGKIFSCADAIAKKIENKGSNSTQSDNSPIESQQPAMKHSHDDDINSNPKNSKGNMVGVCPDCGSALKHEEGCEKCSSCGFSKC